MKNKMKKFSKRHNEDLKEKLVALQMPKVQYDKSISPQRPNNKRTLFSKNQESLSKDYTINSPLPALAKSYLSKGLRSVQVLEAAPIADSREGRSRFRAQPNKSPQQVFSASIGRQVQNQIAANKKNQSPTVPSLRIAEKTNQTIDQIEGPKVNASFTSSGRRMDPHPYGPITGLASGLNVRKEKTGHEF